MDFSQIKNQYRPIPFWSWNSKLDCEETAWQIEQMEAAGIGGYFMHARGGLMTEYMGKEWFDNIQTGVEEGHKRGMSAWAYDENGWPSGFGNGMVNSLGEDYQQKYLRMGLPDQKVEHEIARSETAVFYYDINPYYVDVLSPEVTKVFIQKVYEPYYQKFGNKLKGFFTDEPQISRHGIPWSQVIPVEYEKRYGESIYDHLLELFKAVGDYQNTRMRFYKLITDLFSENFIKKIYDWCNNRGLDFTGHLLLEESLESQLLPNGAAMPHYEYFTMPGMDWLGRNVYNCLTPLQLGSVAQQLGKDQVLAEDYALSGHNVSFEELRRILEWQMVRGVTLLCPHLQGYSIQGSRKRDYPPAMYYQQPWWKEYRFFIDAMARIGMIMSEGEALCDTLLLHPQTSAWICFDFNRNEGLKELNDSFLKTIETLEQKHILFHLGDETILERHGKVLGNSIVIGKQSYTKVVLPEYIDFLPFTKKLLQEYVDNGGVLLSAEDISENDIIDNTCITYTKRRFDSYDIHYFVNSSNQCQKSFIKAGNSSIDLKTGELRPFDGSYEFSPYDSILVFDDRSQSRSQLKKESLISLNLEGEWRITDSTLNSITLDFCDYYFDDVLVEENGYVLNIQARACALERPVNIRCVYHVNIKEIPSEVYLVCERPELYEILINGQKLPKSDNGFFVDSTFRKLDIRKYIKQGQNDIELIVDFKLAPEVYQNLKKARIFESEKNKLTFDMEIEPVYLVGNFGITINSEIKKLEKDAFRCKGAFVINQPKKVITLTGIERQGYLFFAGEISVEKEFFLEETDYQVVFDKKGVNAIRVFANGVYVDTVIWNSTKVDLSHYLVKGKNVIRLSIVNNLRNLLGPHHLKEGESYATAPRSFFKEPCIWNFNPEEEWDEDYCFVETSLI